MTPYDYAKEYWEFVVAFCLLFFIVGFKTKAFKIKRVRVPFKKSNKGLNGLLGK